MTPVIMYIYLLMFSYHSNFEPGCNQNNNPVFGAEFQVKDDRYLLLTLPNSRSNQAVIFAKKHDFFFYGVTSGYKYALTPFIAPMVTFEHGSFSSEIACLSNTVDIVCIFLLRFRFD